MRYTGGSLAVAVLCVLTAAGCGSDDGGGGNAGGITIVFPHGSSPVTTFEFNVTFTIDPNLIDPGTLGASLNGTPLAFGGTGTEFGSVVVAGPPLRDRNTIEVRGAAIGGGEIVVVREFDYLPPKARARQIEDSADLISGPLAHGRIGDYLLANDTARFIIQDVKQRDLYSVGAFGGNLIDLELVDHPGLDNFLEVQPAINIETVINAQTVEIVNDGQDGLAAILRTCGPDDILDFVNPSTVVGGAGFPFPASANDVDNDVEGCTDYILAPGKPYIQMTTTVFNNEDRDLGLYVGDYLNGCGELEQFTSAGAGLGGILVNRLGILSYIGYGEATGVDYSYITFPPPGGGLSTFFSTSGVSSILHAQSVINIIALGAPSNFIVAANGSQSFSRFFGVGDGSAGNGIDIENEVKGRTVGTLRGCVTAAGQPAPNARVSVGKGATIEIVASHFVTDSTGCFEGTLPIGDYSVAAAKRGFLYEGGGTTPPLHRVTIAEGQVTEQSIDLPAAGRLRVNVVDENGDAVPARIGVIGFDPSPEPILTLSTIVGSTRTGLFNDIVSDAVPFGFVWLAYTNSDGTVELDIEPGSFQLFVSRGTEYSAYSQPLNVTGGQTVIVNAQIARVVDTGGFISSDYHVHGIASADSRVSDSDRIRQYAGEGVDNIIMTDHHAHTDLNPRIGELGFTEFVHATIGEEITSWDYGHWNGYPFTIDLDRPSGGSTDWGGAAPAGRDFVEYGAYGLTPAEIDGLARSQKTSTDDTVVQVNHIDSHFRPLRIDTSMVPPQSFLNEATAVEYRLDPSVPNYFHPFAALEVWNGTTRGQQHEFTDLRIGIWFNLLNQGLLTTAIADTDTHELLNLRTAGARTWTPSPSDDPEDIDPKLMARAVSAGRAVGGQGPYLQTRLLAADGSNDVADFSREGSTTVASSNRSVDLEISIQSPIWAPYDTIEIYANAETTIAAMDDGVPSLFSAVPTVVLRAGVDFDVDTVNVFPGIPGAQRLETEVTVPFPGLTEDTWFVVLAKGTDGVSAPMFPVMASDLRRSGNTTLANLLDGNLGENGVLALAMTNALYADVDGEEGFQAPLAP